jgi:SSS family solute:Na+ symporter
LIAAYGSLAFIILYLVSLVVFGIWAERKTETTNIRDFFVARGTVGTTHAFLTALATGFSSFTFLGAIALAYDLGLDGIILAGGALILATPGVALIGRQVWALGRTYGYVTPSDLLGDRFNSSVVRVLVAAIAIIFSFFYIQVQLVGIGYIISVLTNQLISYQAAILITAILVAFYVALGGFRAVLYTDAVQAVLLVIGLLIISVLAYQYALQGAILSAADAAPRIYQIQSAPLYLWTVAVGYGLSVAVWPHLFVRYFAAKNLKGVFSVGFANDIGSILLLTLAAGLIGYVGITVFPGVEPDTVTVQFIQALPLLLAGPMAAAGAAAAKSTADSILLTIGSIYVKDIHAPFVQSVGSQRRLVGITRIVTVAFTALATIAAINPPELLLQYVLDLSFPGFLLLLPVTAAAVYWRRATSQGAISALVAGLITLVLTTFVWSNALNIYPGIWGLVVSSVVLIIVSLLTPPTDKEITDRIHGFLESVDYKALEAEVPAEEPR